MSRSEREPGAGCGGCFGLLLVIGAIVAAAMSLAALVDPFSWMPPIGDVFADCPPAAEVGGSCDLEDRYPGFWLHVLVNLAYSAAARSCSARWCRRSRSCATRASGASTARLGARALPRGARTARAGGRRDGGAGGVPIVVALA